ncbi:MAG: adenylate/guanylate cyclase domain-containing protein [Muribaculaceae bacterium]|nr:adenylate/guanylate cyclase domain-containing protein [Muribaculaceae bacterium]
MKKKEKNTADIKKATDTKKASPPKRRKNRGRTTGISMAVILLFSVIICYFGARDTWDIGWSDFMNQRGAVTNKQIYIIGIDDKTLKKYGPVNTWSRRVPASLVEILDESEKTRPAVIGFDVIYSEDVEDGADEEFARVCAKAGNVVAAQSFAFKEAPERNEKGKIVYNPYEIDYVTKPYENLEKSVTCGFVNTTIDRDGYVRQAMAYLDYEGERVNSFSFQIYQDYMESQGREAVFPDTYGKNNGYYFSYSGKPGGYSVVSLADVLDGTVDAKLFRGAIVLVGAYAVGMQDNYMSAIAHNAQMYGVEIHANIIDALMEGRTQTLFSPVLYALIAGLFCLFFFLILRKARPIYATVTLTVSVFFAIIISRVMYLHGKIVPTILLPCILAFLYLARILQGYLAEILRRRQVVRVLKQYVAPQIVDKISKDKNFHLTLGGENRHIAVLFVDIRGFTTISESLEPEEVVEILNEYLNLTTKAIFDNEGTLDKFVGDATMAIFNAPFSLEDYIFRAICAAWDMKEGAAEIAEKFKKRFGEQVAFGIGIHCGNAVVGNIGCETRMDYTAIGDTVNTAARLESSAKPGQILISGQVYEAVKDRIEAEPVGELDLKGKSNGVFIYQLNGVHR